MRDVEDKERGIRITITTPAEKLIKEKGIPKIYAIDNFITELVSFMNANGFERAHVRKDLGRLNILVK